jgi:hypothetical protein
MFPLRFFERSVVVIVIVIVRRRYDRIYGCVIAGIFTIGRNIRQLQPLVQPSDRLLLGAELAQAFLAPRGHRDVGTICFQRV